MAEQRRSGVGIQEPGGKVLKRRGILAAAGAVVAGIVAKQASAPVGATHQPEDVLLGGPSTASTPTVVINDNSNGLTGGALVGIRNSGNFPLDAYPSSGVIGYGGYSVVSRGVSGYSFTGGTGVFGDGGTGRSKGVYGHNAGGGYGVYGDAGPGGQGITGIADDSYGVIGQSDSGVAVQGQVLATKLGNTGPNTAPNTVAVRGINQSTGANAVGVQGQIASGSTTLNTIAVYGVNQSAGVGGVGVYGASNTGSGVIGVTYGSGGLAGVYGTSTTAYGVIGSTAAAGYSGLTAITGTAGVAALAATATVTTAYAAYFQGATVVQGDFAVVGGNKSAAVKDATGQHRLVYCVESPESWFEDFGKGTLMMGKAEVKLDPVFTQITHTDDYHVFLTPYDGVGALRAARRTAAGFAVEEVMGTSSGTFSYRVVARRADIKGERLAKFTLPKIKIPDESTLQKPAPPKAAPSPLPVTKP